MHIVRCNDASISQLQILAPEDSPNTDGVDVSYSTNVQIQNCKIATGIVSAIPIKVNQKLKFCDRTNSSIAITGDDCISISEGCSNIHIANIQCGPGHGIRFKLLKNC